MLCVPVLGSPTSLHPASASERIATAGEIYPLVPTSAPWVFAIYVGLPLLLSSVQNDPLSPPSFGDYLATNGISTLGIGGLVHASYVWLMPRVLRRIRTRIGRLGAHASCILAAICLGSQLVDLSIAALGVMARGRGWLYETTMSFSISAVVVFASSTYVRLQRDRREAKRREQEAHQASLVAQLKALQLRTNPHFLFNSLNSVASLIQTDPTKAEATLVRLAGLFRYALEGSRRPSVTLREELDITKDYLAVEGLRLGPRLKWEFDLDEELADLRLPPLLLQPLVENAIVHGIAPQPEGGKVRIGVRTEEGQIVLQVQDSGPGSSNRRGTGSSLEDLKRRLDLAYGTEARVERRVDDEGHRVCIRLPQSSEG